MQEFSPNEGFEPIAREDERSTIWLIGRLERPAAEHAHVRPDVAVVLQRVDGRDDRAHQAAVVQCLSRQWYAALALSRAVDQAESARVPSADAFDLNFTQVKERLATGDKFLFAIELRN